MPPLSHPPISFATKKIMVKFNKEEIISDTIRHIQHLLLNRPSTSQNIPNLPSLPDISLISPLYDTALAELTCRLHPFFSDRYRQHCADQNEDCTPMMRSFLIYKVAADWFVNVAPDEAPTLEHMAASLLDSIVAFLRHPTHSTLKRSLSPF